MGDEGDKRIAIIGLLLLAVIAQVGLILLLFFSRGNELGIGALITVIGNVAGALAMYVRPLN